MSKFIKKLNNHKEELYNEELYDDCVDIEDISIEEIDKDIEDFYIDKEKIDNIKFNFNRETIIKDTIDKAERDIEKQYLRNRILKIALVIVVVSSIGIYSPALAHNIPPIMKVLEKINDVLNVDEITSFVGIDKIIPRAVINSDNDLKFIKLTDYKVSEDDRQLEVYSALSNDTNYRRILEGFTYYSEDNQVNLTYDESIELVKKVLSDDINKFDIRIDEEVNKEYIYYKSSKGNFRVGLCYGYKFNNSQLLYNMR